MKLQEVFNYLATGELAQVFLAETGGRDIISDDHQRPTAMSIQLGLTALYKRFDLKTKDVTIQLLPGRISFPLRSQHLVSSTAEGTPKYIEDTPDSPFRDDVLKIERVFTLEGHDLPLNERHNQYSCFNPVPDTVTIPHQMAYQDLDVPEKYKVTKLKVAYRANHPNILTRIGPVNADKVEIELPSSHLQALLYYVASRKMNPVGIVQEFHSGNSWYQKYELECKQLENEGLGFNVDLTHQRFTKNGWV